MIPLYRNYLHYDPHNSYLNPLNVMKAFYHPILRKTYGNKNATQWFNRWRIFYMACAELFGYQNGQEWWVTHYQFDKPKK